MAEIDNIVTDMAPDDNGVALYRFAQGEIGILFNSSTQLAAEATTEIYGDAGTIQQNYGDLPASLLPAEGSALKLFRAGADDWQRFDFPIVPQRARIEAVPRPLVDYLKGEAPPLATAAEGRVCIEMILGAYQSAREGQRVSNPARLRERFQASRCSNHRVHRVFVRSQRLRYFSALTRCRSLASRF